MPVLDETEIEARLGDVAWDRDGDAIVKTVKKGNFPGALGFVNEVGRLAEEMDHHPDIDIRWNTVILRLTTHSEGGLTDLDFALAAKIDGL